MEKYSIKPFDDRHQAKEEKRSDTKINNKSNSQKEMLTLPFL